MLHPKIRIITLSVAFLLLCGCVDKEEAIRHRVMFDILPAAIEHLEVHLYDTDAGFFIVSFDLGETSHDIIQTTRDRFGEQAEVVEWTSSTLVLKNTRPDQKPPLQDNLHITQCPGGRIVIFRAEVEGGDEMAKYKKTVPEYEHLVERTCAEAAERR